MHTFMRALSEHDGILKEIEGPTAADERSEPGRPVQVRRPVREALETHRQKSRASMVLSSMSGTIQAGWRVPSGARSNKKALPYPHAAEDAASLGNEADARRTIDSE
jgi:hypothetical protein